MEVVLGSGAVAVGLLVALVMAVRGAPPRRGQRTVPPGERRASLVARRVGFPESGPSLSTDDVRRLGAFRRRLPELHGEPVGPRTLRQKWAVARRRGVVAWAAASGLGAFSMATHFDVLWLGQGGGWLGVVIITVAATAAMTGICVVLVARLGERE